MSNYIHDQAYTGCIYCSQIQKNALGGREPCTFHKKEKNEALFWSLIRSQKPTNYNGFIFPSFEEYDFVPNTKKLVEAANFWNIGEEPIFNSEICFTDCSFQDLNFEHAVFEEKVEFLTSTINVATFHKTTFFKEIEFNNNKISTLYFRRCEQLFSPAYRKHGIDFSLNDIENIKIEKCEFIFCIAFYNQKKINLHLYQNRKISNIHIERSEIDELSSDYTEINSIYLLNSIINNAEFYNGIINDCEMINSQIAKIFFYSRLNRLDIRSTIFADMFVLQNDLFNNLDRFVDGSNISLETLNIKKECIFSIKDFILNSLEIDNLNIFSDQVRFSNLSITTSFLLANSNVSKVHFNSISIESNCHTSIKDSNIIDCIFNNMHWGNINTINADKDTFRQLKHANDKQSNYLTSHQFYAREMEEYSKTIVNKNLEEKIVFLLGKYISNFSQSWTMPLCWTIIVGIVMYLTAVSPTECLLISSALIIPMLFIFFPKNEIYSYSFSNYLYAVTGFFLIIFIFFSSNFNGLASFINPFGSFLKEHPQHHYFIWLLHKIISSFTIYHFVVALRRSTQR